MTPGSGGTPRIPGLTELLDLMQKQTAALAELPRGITDLQRGVQRLTDVTTKARESTDSAHRITGRFEKLIEDVGPTLEATKPGLRAVSRLLDAPVIATLPHALTRIHDDVMPPIHRLRNAQARVTSVVNRFRGRQTDSQAPRTVDQTCGPSRPIPFARFLGRRARSRSGRPTSKSR